MRFYFITSFLLLFILFSLKAEKRALIVAIGKYPSQSGWRNINSENDVPIIKSALIKQGFRSENIDVLLNQKATKAGIENAFNTLINKSKTNDVLVFHFSGHGQQVTNTNGGGIDGLDEAMVSYDATEFEKWIYSYIVKRSISVFELNKSVIDKKEFYR